MKKNFLRMLERYEEGSFLSLASIYNSMSPADQLRLVTECFEDNIFSINATTRVSMMATIFRMNA